MKTKDKALYDSPTVTVVEVKSAGVICASGGAGVENYTPLDGQTW